MDLVSKLVLVLVAFLVSSFSFSGRYGERESLLQVKKQARDFALMGIPGVVFGETRYYSSLSGSAVMTVVRWP